MLIMSIVERLRLNLYIQHVQMWAIKFVSKFNIYATKMHMISRLEITFKLRHDCVYIFQLLHCISVNFFKKDQYTDCTYQ